VEAEKRRRARTEAKWDALENGWMQSDRDNDCKCENKVYEVGDRVRNELELKQEFVSPLDRFNRADEPRQVTYFVVRP
jgi:hypothetical protein